MPLQTERNKIFSIMKQLNNKQKMTNDGNNMHFYSTSFVHEISNRWCTKFKQKIGPILGTARQVVEKKSTAYSKTGFWRISVHTTSKEYQCGTTLQITLYSINIPEFRN